jgi:hypothetical protein
MTEMMVKIMAEVLGILGAATKEMKQSRASEAIRRLTLLLLEAHVCLEKFLKRIAGIKPLDDGLKKLDKMTNEEARMANAEGLRLGYNIDKKVEGVDEKVQGVSAQVTGIDEKVKVVEKKVDDAKRSSFPFSPAIEYLTRSQGANCLKTLEIGNLLPTHRQTTTSHPTVNTRGLPSGSVEAAKSRNGRWLVPCCGSTGSVCTSLPLNDSRELKDGLFVAGSGKSILW